MCLFPVCTSQELHSAVSEDTRTLGKLQEELGLLEAVLQQRER